jgi:glyoxylase-like metal-dependent hydrolase (beta-lactamase superfamily II)
MRAVAVDPDVIVFISRVWQTTCTAVRAGDEGFVIDSPVYPDELEALPGVLEQSSFPVSGLLATHGDWDHLLGRLAFPEASLGCGESTARRLVAESGNAQRELRRFDQEHYVERPRPLALAGIQALPVPGRLSIGPSGGSELELHDAEGHTADGVAFWLPGAQILVCGDYLSPVEIPMISAGGSTAAYAATLARLTPLAERAATVVPGHGSPLLRERALAILSEDAAYLEALERDGAAAALPASRRSDAQKRVHAANVAAAGLEARTARRTTRQPS